MTTISSIPMSPPASPTSSPSAKSPAKHFGDGSPLSIDLSSLPPLVQPSPPSNTLLITNLNDPALFNPSSLEFIKSLLSSQNPLNSFSPLRSFRRIIVSYLTTDAAIQARQLIDGAASSILLQGQGHGTATVDRIRCFFGETTPIVDEIDESRYLKAPDPGKLFFISPPPSPPCGWEIREEDPPNKDTHAEDLERALAGLSHKTEEVQPSPTSHGQEIISGEQDLSEAEIGDIEARKLGSRNRSRSTTVYDPKHHGDNQDLPAVMVEDTSADEDELSALPEQQPITKTSRPPVELMAE